MTPRKSGDLCYHGKKVDLTTWNRDGADLSHLVGRCRDCGKIVRGREAVPDADPYSEEINDDKTPVVECDVCRDDSCMST